MTVVELPLPTPPEKDKPEGFSSHDVCAIADISYRQCDYWDRAGVVEPSIRPACRSGSRRRYSDDDVLRICIVAALIDAGISLTTIREHLAHLAMGTLFLDTGTVTITVDVNQLRRRIEQYRRAAS